MPERAVLIFQDLNAVLVPVCPQLYSPAGRRLGGPFKLGAGLARLACDSGWLLLAITTSGRVKLLHVGQQRSLLSTSVAPLVEDGAQGEHGLRMRERKGASEGRRELECCLCTWCMALQSGCAGEKGGWISFYQGRPTPTWAPPCFAPCLHDCLHGTSQASQPPPNPLPPLPPAVVDARLSRQGWPMLTLSSHKAYLWHPGLEEWMCAAEEAYAASPFMPTMRLQNQGEGTQRCQVWGGLGARRTRRG